jgi:hypothetical protein
MGTPLLPQGTTGQILGVVYDQSRAVLPGVTVTATNRDTGLRRDAVTDDQGRYVIAQMRIGRYALDAELPGFQSPVREVTLTLQGDLVVDFTLTVGAAATEIVVTGEAPLIETTSSSLKGLVDQQQIQDLPLNGRSFTDLVGLQTGVSINYNQLSIDNASTAKFNINGTRSTMQSFTLDGTELKNQWGATPGSVNATMLGVDTVREFSVITGVASAEYGGFVGGVVSAITRSGTNEFHGTVYAFHRNDNLDATNFFTHKAGQKKPEFKRNQYGFTIGGPIVPDKAFFFGSFEGLNERLPTTQTARVPSADARNGIFGPGLCADPDPVTNCNVEPDPFTADIVNSYPLRNGGLLGQGEIGNYFFPNPRKTDQYYYLAKVDWQVTDQDSIAGRWVVDDSKISVLGDPLGLVPEGSGSKNQYVLLEWNRVFSSTVVNEARVSYNRSPIVTAPESFDNISPAMVFNPNFIGFKTGEPRPGEITFRDDTTVMGYSQRRGRVMILNRFQYIDNLSITSGAHSLKMGFNIHRLQHNYLSSAFAAGAYTFTSIRDLVGNNPAELFSGGLSPVIMRGVRHTKMGFYVQDDWRVRPNLTLNLGLRYEPYNTPSEVAGRISTLRRVTDQQFAVGNPMFTVNPSLQNLAPRIGFAWDPFEDGKTAIRGGYGLFYDLLGPVHYRAHAATNLPFFIRITRPNPPFPDPSEGLSLDPDTVVTNPAVIADNIEQGGVHQYQLSVQRELFQDLMIQLEYRGSYGYNLGHLVDANYALPGTDANGVFPFWEVGSERHNPRFAQLRNFNWDANSFYNAFGLTLRKRLSQGFSLQVTYTLGKSIDDASSSGPADTGGTPNGATHFPFDVRFDRGLSGFDVRNRLVINGSWDLPGNNLSGAARHILGGWTLNGILTTADGNHGTVQHLFNHSRSQGTGAAFDVVDRPNLIPGGDNNPVLFDGRNPDNYFDTSQFEVLTGDDPRCINSPGAGCPGYLGNLARGTIENPGIITLDFSIFKNISFSEDNYLQFRAEFFNIANRTNFEQVGTFFGGNIWLFLRLGPEGAPIIQRSTANRITNTATTARQMQFALKYYF